MQIFSFSPFGYEGALVTVEVDLRRGIPAIDMVGLADSAVKESRDRMQAAIRNAGFSFPPERVLISLSPADLKKEGAGFDLPVALSVLKAQAESSGCTFADEDILVMGELELSGKIRAVKGVNAAVSTAIAGGITKCIVPEQNADEAREVAGVMVYGADCLENAFRALQDSSFFQAKDKHGEKDSQISETCTIIEGVEFQKVEPGYEYAEIKGQGELVRALQIAAAGGHNFIAVGAPGCGKTMALQKFPALLPFLTLDEAHSVTRIWSLAGLIKPSQPLIRIAPFRMPHQTASIEGICGGGPSCRPGEISLAHNGVLFLDEAAEFRSSVLQMLRVPIENKSITLSRAGRTTTYPANFQLLMAVNPCPCGNYGSSTKICLCSGKSIEQYWKKFSAPLLDRVDLRVFVDNPDAEKNEDKGKSYTTEELRKGIAKAIKLQRKRQGIKNARLTPQQIVEFCEIDSEGKLLLEKAADRFNFSPRAISSCLKTARTIADLEESPRILSPHLQEAISYRKLCSNTTPEL
ncbi:MAG: YifB family Mg chelatase-like AAA ATPase [Treponema sp.]|nr:YifB family Mg chelatase-like AAA ATPase [Treponema sp.]